MSLSSSIKEWINLNKKYDMINASLKEIKKHKTEKEAEVLRLMKASNIQDKVISLNNSKLFVQNTKNSPPISQKLLREVFEDLGVKESIVETIFEAINKKRVENIKENMVLKIK